MRSLFLPAFLALSSVAVPVYAEKMYAVHISNFRGELPHSAQGYKTLTYPINVLSGPPGEMFYYSQFVYFNNSYLGGAYYTGIQPTGKNRARALFSVFGKGVRPESNWCTREADRRDGSTCAIDIPFRFNTEYRFIANLLKESSSGNTWDGRVIDPDTDTTYFLGSWTTPKSWGYLSGRSIGFVEDYVGIHSCSEIEPTSVSFKPGTGTLPDGNIVTGRLFNAYEAGKCKGRVPFSLSPVNMKQLRGVH